MTGHRIPRKKKNWLKHWIETKENSGDLGRKASGQTHQGSLCHSAHNSHFMKRAFECLSLGHMLIPCTEEAGYCDWQPPPRLDPLGGGGCGSPGTRGRESGPRQAKATDDRCTQHYRKPLENAIDSSQCQYFFWNAQHWARAMEPGEPRSQGAQALPQLLHQWYSLQQKWDVCCQLDNVLAHIIVHGAKVRNDWEMSPDLDQQTNVISELETWTVSHTQPTLPCQRLSVAQNI